MILLWALSVVAAFGLGYYFHSLNEKIHRLEQEVRQKIDKPPEEPSSEIIDPFDEVQQAQYELKKRMQDLNQ